MRFKPKNKPFTEMPFTKVSATSADDCDILYEKITSSSHCRTQNNAKKLPTAMDCSCHVIQNQHRTCKLTGSEYPNYAAEELALFFKLQSGSMQCSADVKIKAPSEESVDLGIETLGHVSPVNSSDTEKDSEPMDCEVLWAKSVTSTESEKDLDSKDCEVLWAKSADSSDPGAADQPAKELGLMKNSEFGSQGTTPKNCNMFNDPKKELKQDSISLTTNIYDVSSSLKQLNKRPKSVMKTCKICQASVTSDYELKRHLLNHVDNTKGIAEIYTKSIVALQQLDYRFRTARSQKRNVCVICQKVFSKLTDLRYHNNVSHSDKRPYQCRLCHKNYTRSYHLTRHEFTHHK